jgi:hypothetical protein
MVHKASSMHLRKDHILQISSNGYLRGFGAINTPNNQLKTSITTRVVCYSQTLVQHVQVILRYPNTPSKLR